MKSMDANASWHGSLGLGLGLYLLFGRLRALVHGCMEQHFMLINGFRVDEDGHGDPILHEAGQYHVRMGIRCTCPHPKVWHQRMLLILEQCVLLRWGNDPMRPKCLQCRALWFPFCFICLVMLPMGISLMAFFLHATMVSKLGGNWPKAMALVDECFVCTKCNATVTMPR